MKYPLGISNRLLSVVNNGAKPGTMTYDYDQIGNLVKDSDAEIDTIFWSVTGKIRNIVRHGSSSLKDLYFDYDPSGNIIGKHVLGTNGGSLEKSPFKASNSIWHFKYK
jgi:YD repeat-containing protein